MKNFRYILLMVLTAAFIFTACDSVVNPDYVHSTAYQAEENFSFQIASNEINTLDLYSLNGSVRVIGSAKVDDISITGTKTVKSESQRDAGNYLEYLHVSFAQQANVLYVDSEQPEDSDGREVTFNYIITVPNDFAAKVNLLNGVCYFDSLRNTIEAELTNGDVYLQAVRGSVTASVTNGQIQGDLELPINGTLRGRATNGQIQLDVPANTSARLYAEVVNGSVNVTGLSVQNMSGSRKSISGTLGSGAGLIDLKTTNGNISLNGN